MMMKIFKTFLIMIIAITSTALVHAQMENSASRETINLLKKDLRGGHVVVGTTRLKEVTNTYGLPEEITNDSRKIIFNYGDLKLEFDKDKIWKSWSYDSFKDAIYNEKIDELRFDLESGELVGVGVSAKKIMRTYGDPTEMTETDNDGDDSIYYYGDIKLVFENQVVVRGWKGQNLKEVEEKGILGSKPTQNNSESGFASN